MYGDGYALLESVKVRILTDDNRIVTRWVPGNEYDLGTYTLEEIVEDVEKAKRIREEPSKENIKEWLMNEIEWGCQNPLEAICKVVSLLSKHGWWKDYMSKWVNDIYAELEIREKELGG